MMFPPEVELPVVFAIPQEQVERVFQKQSSVQEMFEKRRISLKKLAAKQTRPVQPVAPRPEVKSPLSSPSKRGSIDGDLMKEQHGSVRLDIKSSAQQDKNIVFSLSIRPTEKGEKILCR